MTDCEFAGKPHDPHDMFGGFGCPGVTIEQYAESLAGEGLDDANRVVLATALLPAGGLPLVDAIVALSQRLDGAAFDTLRDRLANVYDAISVEGIPSGLVVVRERGQYSPHVDGTPLTDPLDPDDLRALAFDDYHDALDRLRVWADDHPALDGDDTIVTYCNLDTGLICDLFPIEQIAPGTPGKHDAEFWRLSEGAAGREALCALCGETFNPNGPDDMTHLMRADEHECGGPGVPVGWWR